MKREEKNLLSRQKIIEYSLKEFAEQGYGLSSINTICSTGNISKGIVYHYFKDKDEIYLMCVKECFDALTAYLRENMEIKGETIDARLESYFGARLNFFKQHSLYQKLFCDVVISPPAHLEKAIREMKSEFDDLNIEILSELLEQKNLRNDVTKAEVIDTFRQYQDFINARYQMVGTNDIFIDEREKHCKRALSILLYGVIAREKE